MASEEPPASTLSSTRHPVLVSKPAIVATAANTIGLAPRRFSTALGQGSGSAGGISAEPGKEQEH